MDGFRGCKWGDRQFISPSFLMDGVQTLNDGGQKSINGVQRVNDEVQRVNDGVRGLGIRVRLKPAIKVCD
jgi:hypothetical protein